MKKIPLFGKYGKGKFAFIDDDDFDLVSKYHWAVDYDGYAKRRTTFKKLSINIHMHRLILGKKSGFVADHIDKNRLNNVRSNLRHVTREQNSWNRTKPKNNTSGFSGVVWSNKSKKWQAQIGVYRQTYYLGLFDDVLEAALVRDSVALAVHGKYASLNEDE